MSKYTEIFKLKDMLDKAGIPYGTKKFQGGLIIHYPKFDFHVCSAIEHNFSYGHEENLIEIYGLLTKEEQKVDKVVGWLTAEEVFKRIESHYKESEEK